MRILTTCLFCLLILSSSMAQQITKGTPSSVDPAKKYVFYLHGGIIESQGVNAVSPYYGPYKYLDILDSLAGHGYHVISEARPEGTDQVRYAEKVIRQIDILLSMGVDDKNIVIVGASLGAYITIEIANLLKNENVNYALLGLCSDYAVGFYQKYNQSLQGNFLSFYESKDEKHSCAGIFDNQSTVSSYKELRLTMGNGHAFLYLPYDEWVLPLVEWIER